MKPHFTEVLIKCTCGKHLGTLDLENYPAEFEVEPCEDCSVLSENKENILSNNGVIGKDGMVKKPDAAGAEVEP